MSKPHSERKSADTEDDVVADEDEREVPDIEEELFEEELRIDGICGVY